MRARARSRSCTRPPRGTGSTPRSAIARRTRCCDRAGTSRSGARSTRSPAASIRSSPRSRRSTTRSARAIPAKPGRRRLPRSCPTPRRRSRRPASSTTCGCKRYVWEATYTAEEYVSLLDTFSGHMSMDAAKRAVLYDEIRRRIGARADRRVRRHLCAILHVARRSEGDVSGAERRRERPVRGARFR